MNFIYFLFIYFALWIQVLSFKLNVGHFPHLSDLVTRINYNYYYMTLEGQILTPIPDAQGHLSRRPSRR
jgi:gamma-tubulin complex component 5